MALPVPETGLDDEQSWIIASEVNAFEWPGPDLRLVDRKNPDKGFVYGHLPKRLALEIVGLVRAERLAGRLGLTKRDA